MFCGGVGRMDLRLGLKRRCSVSSGVRCSARTPRKQQLSGRLINRNTHIASAGDRKGFPGSRKKGVPGDKGWDPLRVRENEREFDKIREVEVIHARWSMLGVLALVLSDVAGHPVYPLDAPSFASFFPWAVLAVVMLGILETYRMQYRSDSSDFDARTYPGRQFDPLGISKGKGSQAPGIGVYSSWLGGVAGWFAGGWWLQKREMTEAGLNDLKTKELNNGRLAMISFAGCCVASFATGKGPYTLLLEHVADPLHATFLQRLVN